MKSVLGLLLVIALSFGAFSIWRTQAGSLKLGDDLMQDKPINKPVATFAGGCFWCLESEYRSRDGVLFTRVGYMGGKNDNPTYNQVSSGTTNHAEVVEITYDPEQVTYEELVRYFLTSAHDPTQLNRQGVDVGTQYRSAIFYHSKEQEDIARKIIAELEAEKYYSNDIVTQVVPAETFWEGENYHQQYYEKYEDENGQPHIRVMLKKQKLLVK